MWPSAKALGSKPSTTQTQKRVAPVDVSQVSWVSWAASASAFMLDAFGGRDMSDWGTVYLNIGAQLIKTISTFSEPHPPSCLAPKHLPQPSLQGHSARWVWADLKEAEAHSCWDTCQGVHLKGSRDRFHLSCPSLQPAFHSAHRRVPDILTTAGNVSPLQHTARISGW